MLLIFVIMLGRGEMSREKSEKVGAASCGTFCHPTGQVRCHHETLMNANLSDIVTLGCSLILPRLLRPKPAHPLHPRTSEKFAQPHSFWRTHSMCGYLIDMDG